MHEHHAESRPPLTAIDLFLDYYAERKRQRAEAVYCFQVGANDGKSNDPVHKYFRDYTWHGLLIEPQRDVFEQGLSKTYQGNPRVEIENAALGSEDGSLPFYRVAISRARWATGLSSFIRSSLERHIASGYIARKAREEGVAVPDDASQLIETVQVPTFTVETLLARHGVQNFDVLCIDTEGFDFEILKLVDFDRYTPEVVLFESNNLSKDDFVAAHSLLKSKGYELFWEKGDTLAVKTAYPAIRRHLHRIRALLRTL